MTGTPRSNSNGPAAPEPAAPAARRPRAAGAGRLAAVCAALVPGLLGADRVTLDGDHQLTGQVTSVDAGQVTLVSELSAAPLVLQQAAVRAVTFAPPEAPPQPADQQLHLVNGDVIPCRVESMDERLVRVSTWFAGNLEVPRQHVAALHFNVTEPTLILATTDALRGWSESDAWTADETAQTLTSAGTGKISRQLDPGLPARFIIRFRYQWQGNPGLRFYFADQLDAEGAVDRYFLTINAAGIELKRQSSRGATYSSLAQDPRRPNDVSPDGIDVELRVNREPREPLLHLLLNGDLVGRFVDPFGNAPTGSALVLESTAGGNSNNTIGRLQVLEWAGDSSTRPKRPDDEPDKDAVCDRQGERFAGTAERIAPLDGRPVIVFHHPHAADPLHIPLDQAASLWLRQPQPPPAPPDAPLALTLAGNGSLQLADCRIDAQSATCTHPLLGPLTVDRRAIAALASHRPAPAGP